MGIRAVLVPPLLCCTMPALANSAVAPLNQLLTPIGDRPTPIEVLREEISIVCSRPDDRPSCDFTARYQLENPTDSAEQIGAAFYGIATQDVRITIDGRDADALSEDRLAALEKLAAQKLRTYSSANAHYGFRAELDPHQQRTLEITGVIRPHDSFAEGYFLRGMKVRHFVLAEDELWSSYDFEYVIEPIRTFARVGPIAVSFSTPSDWKIADRSQIQWRSDESAGRTVRTTTISASTDSLALVMSVPADAEFGGPIIGIGATLGDRGRVRGRLGWQITFPDYLLYTLAVDTDFSELVTIVPSVELVLPLILIFIPSITAGIGVPIQAHRAVDAGIRFQVTASYPFLGMAFAYDLFFGDGTDAWSILATIGL